jgi:hypothetical protein
MRIQIWLPVYGATSGWFSLVVCAFFSISAGAADDLLAEARIVAQTERAFSVRCAEIGFRDSFLEYFAAGGDVSGNLGFTYGTASDAKSSTAYLRVWLCRQSTW